MGIFTKDRKKDIVSVFSVIFSGAKALEEGLEGLEETYKIRAISSTTGKNLFISPKRKHEYSRKDKKDLKKIRAAKVIVRNIILRCGNISALFSFSGYHPEEWNRDLLLSLRELEGIVSSIKVLRGMRLPVVKFNLAEYQNSIIALRSLIMKEINSLK